MGTLALFATAAERDLCWEALDEASKHPRCGVPACMRFGKHQAYKVNKGKPTPITGPVCKAPGKCPFAALHLTDRWDRLPQPADAGAGLMEIPPAWAVVLTDEVRSYSGVTVEMPTGSYTIPAVWNEYDPAPNEQWVIAPDTPPPARSPLLTRVLDSLRGKSKG